MPELKLIKINQAKRLIMLDVILELPTMSLGAVPIIFYPLLNCTLLNVWKKNGNLPLLYAMAKT